MRRASLTLLILALVVSAFAMIRWVALGRQISEEREEQTRTGRVVFTLSRQEGWKSAEYTPRRWGLYSLVLETQGRNWTPHPVATFNGTFDIELHDPVGNLVKQMRVHAQSLHHTNESHVHWSPVDTVTINPSGVGSWKIRVSTSQADDNFKETVSAIILQPPAHIDIGWASFSRWIEVALIAGVGFILLSASGALWYFANRNIRQQVRR